MITEKIYNVSGIVQGVGFRPMCVRIARETGVKGSVANTSDGVLLTLQGTDNAIAMYISLLRLECPDVAMITSITLVSEHKIESTDQDFIIRKSVRSERQRVLLPPDMATCSECIADMKDPSNRRYRYPFTNCTNCGPRFSIVRTLPYDRPCTTMSVFPMCKDCETEYCNEEDRRFHAQPNACPDCGPHIAFCTRDGTETARGENALASAVRMLRDGRIIAIKGLGGFHLACDARNEETVQLLRKRKRRPSKPFAIMASNEAQIKTLAEASDADISALSGSRAPILLLPKKDGSLLAPSLAPGLIRLGVMLPYTPLHHLLLSEISPLVMTSANLSGDALVSDNGTALRRLRDICDGFLVHNRDIHMKIDDSVLLPTGRGNIILRRARGFVPNPVILRDVIAPVFAAGAEMKGTFAFSQDNMIFPSQYLGDLKNLENAAFYSQALTHFRGLYNFSPSAVAVDLHPLYLSRTLAKKAFASLPVLEVQHHYAHMMACMAENRLDVPAVGLIMDGTGYGTDGTVWGGEVLAGDARGFDRAGHLRPFRLPGGDRATEEIWRCGFSLMVEAFGPREALSLCETLWEGTGAKAEQLLKAWESFPLCSSLGRLFDGVASIAMKRRTVTYDGEGAMQFEALATPCEQESGYSMDTNGSDIDWRDFVRSICNSGMSVHEVSHRFHVALARAFRDAASHAARSYGTRYVALSGGCWQNATLMSLTIPMLERAGLTPLTHSFLSPNDECISTGQAYVAGKHSL